MSQQDHVEGLVQAGDRITAVGRIVRSADGVRSFAATVAADPGLLR